MTMPVKPTFNVMMVNNDRYTIFNIYHDDLYNSIL